MPLYVWSNHCCVSSETSWTSHDRACKAFHKGYKQVLDALAICSNRHKESEDLGFLFRGNNQNYHNCINVISGV